DRHPPEALTPAASASFEAPRRRSGSAVWSASGSPRTEDTPRRRAPRVAPARPRPRSRGPASAAPRCDRGSRWPDWRAGYAATRGEHIPPPGALHPRTRIWSSCRAAPAHGDSVPAVRADFRDGHHQVEVPAELVDLPHVAGDECGALGVGEIGAGDRRARILD